MGNEGGRPGCVTTLTGRSTNWPVEEAVPMASRDIYHACTRLSKGHNRV